MYKLIMNASRLLSVVALLFAVAAGSLVAGCVHARAFPAVGAALVAAGLEMARSLLYRFTDSRVDEMISAGLVDEVESLAERGLLRKGTTAGVAIGYRQILNVLEKFQLPQDSN